MLNSIPPSNLSRLALVQHLRIVRRLQIPIRAKLGLGEYVAGAVKAHPLWQLERDLLAQCFGAAVGEDEDRRLPAWVRDPWPRHAFGEGKI